MDARRQGRVEDLVVAQAVGDGDGCLKGSCEKSRIEVLKEMRLCRHSTSDPCHPAGVRGSRGRRWKWRGRSD
jgi:hypothetical protein